jgi:hypothetical protein
MPGRRSPCLVRIVGPGWRSTSTARPSSR